MEEDLNALEEKDLVSVASVAARIYNLIKQKRTEYSSPKEFGEKGLAQLTHNDRLLAFSFLCNIREIDTNSFYKPEDLREIILKGRHEDVLNVQNSLPYDMSPNKIEYKDMNKAITKLAKVIDFKKVDKKEIRKIAREKHISFSGRPSLYQFKNVDLETLEYVYTKPWLINLVIKTLKGMGLVDDFAYFLEGVFRSMANNAQEEKTRPGILRKKEVLDKVFDTVTNTGSIQFEAKKDDFHLLINELQSIDETGIGKLAKLCASQVVETPQMWPLLLLFLLPS